VHLADCFFFRISTTICSLWRFFSCIITTRSSKSFIKFHEIFIKRNKKISKYKCIIWIFIRKKKIIFYLKKLLIIFILHHHLKNNHHQSPIHHHYHYHIHNYILDDNTILLLLSQLMGEINMVFLIS